MNAPRYRLISRADELEAAAAELARSPVLGFDTEFIPEKSYLPQLGLLQLASARQTVLIDPVAVTDLSCLRVLCADGGPVLVSHAGESDWALFAHHVGLLPERCFDTQMAWAFLSTTLQVGYARLVDKLLGKRLHKQETVTNWQKRPLPKAMLDYAAQDVALLLPLYEKLSAKLKGRGREPWVEEECQRLRRRALIPMEGGQESFRRVKGAAGLEARGLAIVRELDAWRRRVALEREQRLTRVLSDHQIVMLAQHRPADLDALKRLRGLYGSQLRGDADALLACVDAGLTLPEDQCPAPENRARDTSSWIEQCRDLAQVYARARAEALHIAPALLLPPALAARILADLDDVEAAVFEHLTGWRRDLVAEGLSRLLSGKDALRLCPKTRALVATPMHQEA